MTPAPRRIADSIGSTLVLSLGLALVCVAVGMHWVSEKHAKVETIPLVVGFILALGAALWKDPRRAKEVILGVSTAGDRAVDSVVRLRTGRERGAPVVEIKKTSDAAQPGANPATTVSVTTATPEPADPALVHELELPPTAKDLEPPEMPEAGKTSVPPIFPLPTERSD